jgi:long-chain fatty acid transport protein
MGSRNYHPLAPLLITLASLPCTSPALGQGPVLPGAGPINLSMAGASTAAAVDVGGSYWNPAVISGLPRSEMLLSSHCLFHKSQAALLRSDRG